MRLLTGHKVNLANDQLLVEVLDKPGQGNACHEYSITLPNAAATRISFQNGPINEVGVNGLTHEALIAILIDRLEGFQSGPYACSDNAQALHHLQETQRWLHNRTLARISRGVEGTPTV
jgi:hypothetical protein